MASDEIRVVYRKFDGSLHWHFGGRLLGEDDHGVWVGCEIGTVTRRGSELEVTWPVGFVVLFPRSAWWTASFNAEPDKTAVYCDITTVPKWHDDVVTMVDLDLDVIRRRDGEVFVDDEDEFAEHRVRYAYPPDVVAAAQDSAEWLEKAVRAGVEPFGGAHEPWLDEVM